VICLASSALRSTSARSRSDSCDMVASLCPKLYSSGVSETSLISAHQPMARQPTPPGPPNASDVVGVCLLAEHPITFLNDLLRPLNTRFNQLLCSGAEGSVFVSGLVSAWVFGRIFAKQGEAALRRRAWHRARDFYLTHFYAHLDSAGQPVERLTNRQSVRGFLRSLVVWRGAAPR